MPPDISNEVRECLRIAHMNALQGGYGFDASDQIRVSACLKQITPPEHDGVFWHECEAVGCTRSVEFDDEPYCFTHSPDEGSSVRGYSARAKSQKIPGEIFEEMKPMVGIFPTPGAVLTAGAVFSTAYGIQSWIFDGVRWVPLAKR